jgi:hypothetical protein
MMLLNQTGEQTMTTKISYLNDIAPYGYYVKREATAPRNNSRTGYGNKIPTSYLVNIQGEKRWRRVYAICWSNCASMYVHIKDERIFLSDIFESEFDADGISFQK